MRAKTVSAQTMPNAFMRQCASTCQPLPGAQRKQPERTQRTEQLQPRDKETKAAYWTDRLQTTILHSMHTRSGVLSRSHLPVNSSCVNKELSTAMPAAPERATECG